MNKTTVGMRGHLYEYLFYRTIEQTQKNLGSTIMVSQARHLREKVGEKLAEQGLSMTDPDLKIAPVLHAIEDTMTENVPGYSPLFAQTEAGGIPFSGASIGYKMLSKDFMAMTGLSSDGAGTAGPRLPISPYDPRWATRSTVKAAGSSLLNIPNNLIEELTDNSAAELSSNRSEELMLFKVDEEGKNQELGQASTVDDFSGMTELMNKMSAREYRDTRKWLVDGGLDENGAMDYDRFMSPEALARAVAILNELGDQGTPYKVVRDRNQGQLKAQIDGTKISVRLTDIKNQEHYVGRVYDDGVITRYTTNHKDVGSDKTVHYTPTAQESVDLLRIAQGREVQRADGRGAVGAVGSRMGNVWSKTEKRSVPTAIQESYHSSGSASFKVGDLVDEAGEPTGSQVMVRRDASNHSATSRFFVDEVAASTYLKLAVGSARDNLGRSLGVDEMLAAMETHREEAVTGDWFPEFNGNPEIAGIQRSYWDVLRGDQSALLRPGATEDAYLEKLSIIGELGLDSQASANHQATLAELVYVGSPEEQVREHASDTLDAFVGSYRLHEVRDAEGNWIQQRFDPVRLAKYMTSEFGTWRNNDDIVSALRVAEIAPEELMGESFYNSTIKDRLITFDASTAQPLGSIKDPFVALMGQTVHDTIERNGAVVTDLSVDDQGIVLWSADRQKGLKGEVEQLTGQIGQIFSRGAHGEIVTQFAGGDNYLFMPGYEAGISVQKPGENKSVEERTKLRGYEQIMADQVQYRVASDLLGSRTQVGEPTSLNQVYRRLYDVRHEVDFIERSAEEGLSDDWRDAILATEGRRVRYPNSVRDGSTINAEYQAEKGRGVAATDPANDNSMDPWILTGKRNMSIMTEESDGYFDPVVTSSSINQGVTRYLVEGAVVAQDGSITPGAKDDRTPLMKHPDTALMAFNPFDRQQMTASNLMQAAAVTPPVRTAMMTFGGWTADDPMVVSQRFAEQHQIRAVDGTMRNLVVGDKLSDLHGNKGVISLVIDPAMDDYAAKDQQLVEAVGLFRANPELDVVMSPFSAVSRFNGGSAREMMTSIEAERNANPAPVYPADGDPADLADYSQALEDWENSQRSSASTLWKVDAEGAPSEAQYGSVGEMRFIVTHMAVDSKTRVYDDEALAQGRGRKASSQLAWALSSHGADKVLAECYGPNSTAVGNFREMLVTMGLDMEADGTLRIGSDEMDPDNERRLFEMSELLRTAPRGTNRPALNANQMKRNFGALIGDKGGDLELPFALKLPSEHLTPAATDTTYRLPVLSSHLRSGQDLDDGSSTVHDYTNHYLTIHEQASRYRFAQEELADPSLTSEQRHKQSVAMAQAPRLAQAAFDTITDDLKARRFTGKHNVFKEQLMASRLPHSATAVWTSDPRLDIDQVSMGSAMADALGFKEGDYATIWRDPVLRDGGVRYMRVTIDERLTGVAIHPAMDACFDGDFDGDAVAIVRLTSEAAKLDAMQKLSVEANLLDLGTQLEDGTYPLAMQDSLDTKVSQHMNPALAQRFEDLRMRANDVKFDLDEGSIDQAEAWERNSAITSELSDYYHDALSHQYGDATLSFEDVPTHLKSVMSACVETGAKGSAKKVHDYAHYLGADPETFADLGVTQATREDHEGVMYATAIKSFGTGVAGTFSQRGVKALRNMELKPVLELTYPVTQSVLQAKHDPKEARQKYEMLMGPTRSLWQGRKLNMGVNAAGVREWTPAKDERGKEIQADTATWEKQFVELYSAKDGLNVSINPENVSKIAAALSVDGVMIDMEEEPAAADERAMGSTMDRLGYGGEFSDVLAAAAARENVFSGEQNAHFAPFAIRKNQKALAEFDAQVMAGIDVPLPEMVPLNKLDVLPEHHEQSRTRGTVTPTRGVATVKAPAQKVYAPVVPKHEVSDLYEDQGSVDEQQFG